MSIYNEVKEYDSIYFPNIWDNSINHEQDNIVQSKKKCVSDYNMFGPIVRSFMDISKSPEMLEFLEKITGIDGLESDPHLYGGGIHRTTTGGRLAIHADFNIHLLTGKHRRLNVLLYLNPDWKPEYNGEFELWQTNMNGCAKKVVPIINRLVLFRIRDDAYHGHPEIWNAPQNIPRYSIALYYYTNDRPNEEKNAPHMALWKARYNGEF
jgi:Rps23 Pro-64 3,4-dihydroxylase Tpa1-like proline 4-hydroxylase